jgi:hypothetical protein
MVESAAALSRIFPKRETFQMDVFMRLIRMGRYSSINTYRVCQKLDNVQKNDGSVSLGNDCLDVHCLNFAECEMLLIRFWMFDSAVHRKSG